MLVSVVFCGLSGSQMVELAMLRVSQVKHREREGELETERLKRVWGRKSGVRVSESGR